MTYLTWQNLICYLYQTEEEEALVFLFSKTEQAGISQPKAVHMPPRVTFMVTDPTAVLQYQVRILLTYERH